MPRQDAVPSLAALFGDLLLQKICFTITGVDCTRLPDFLGSALRGVLGWETLRLVCPFTSRPACNKCTVRDHCPYYILFEMKGSLPGFADIPRGYVVAAGRRQSFGQLWLEITLLGNCTRFLPVVIAAIFSGRKRGLGNDRLPYHIENLTELLPGRKTRPLSLSADAGKATGKAFTLADWLETEKRLDGPVRLHLISPLRLRRQGSYLGEFDGPFFLETLARRLETIHCLHGTGSPLPETTKTALRKMFSTFSPHSQNIVWKDQDRFSNRQGRKVPLGGLVGDIEAVISLAMDQWLRAAELLHVGKGASMGMGRVEIVYAG